MEFSYGPPRNYTKNKIMPIYANGTTPAVQEYIATLQQTATANPTATVIKNTIGGIVWTRESAGYYKGTLENAFPINKTIVTFTNGENRVISVYSETDTIEIYQVVETSGSQVPTDNIYNGTIQIYVYQ